MGDYDALAGLFGGMAIFGIILVLLLFAYIIVAVIANWKMYKKAGKAGWECIVPVYGYWVLAEIAGLEWWWFLLAIVDSIISILGIEGLSSIANLVSLFATFNIYYNIAKRFGKDKGTAIAAGIFSGIFVLIFGYSKNEVYDANIPVSKNGVFGTPEGNFNNSNANSTQYNNVQAADNMNNFNANQQNNDTQSTETVDMNNNYQNNSFCGNCGTKLEKDIRFCPNCGKENI